MPRLQEVIGDYPVFLDEILSQVHNHGFEFSDFAQIDHMCYRTVSEENYQQKKSELLEVAKFLGESTINKRLISVFRLNDPVIFDRWRIDAIELPAPKPDNQHLEGLEHVEFVLYDDFTTFFKKYPDKKFDMSSADRGINPEIGFRLGAFSVKFHLLALPTVLYLENKLKNDQV